MKNKCKFAAGEKLGLRSAVWSVDINKNDVYVSTNHFSKNTKISLHESGDGQWSHLSNVWGKENRSNQERHIAKWKSKNIVGLNAVNIFRIKIPHTELRTYSDLPKKGVKWVSGLISGTYQFDLYITPESETNPVENRNDLPYIVLYSSQLQNKKWLIIFYQASNSIEIDSVKESLVLEMRDKNIDMSGDRMIALFDDGSSGNVPTMIECAYTISR